MDAHLLEALLDRHAAPLELYAAQWSSAPADVVQEAFIRFVQQDEPPRDQAAWLYRVVRNLAVSSGRSEQRRRRHETQAAGRSEPWFEPAEHSALDAAGATEALQELPIEQREVIVAHVWGGLSFQQIADLAEISSSTAHRRYEAGLAALRERLGLSCKTKTQKKPSCATSSQP